MEVVGSIPTSPTNVDGSSNGRASDCGSDGCEFDSHPSTQIKKVYLPSSSAVEHLTVNQNVAGSIPAGGARREVVQLGRTRALGA